MTTARALFALLALAVVGSGCGVGGDGGATTSATSTPATTSSGATTSSAPAGDVGVRVYFAWHEMVGTAGRTVTAPTVARGAIEALLAGPDEFEAGLGMATQIPDGTDLLGLDIAGGTATVDLSGEFASGGGSLSMQLRVAQVVFTLTQFDTVDHVDVHLDGEAVDAIGGEGVPATDLTREDFANVTPFILVESPFPGETVASPLEVSGIANTFEANVRYSITDPDGLILDDGFTTASAGNGVWGDFSFTTEFQSARAGQGAVIAFQEDAATGAQRDVYEVPVHMG